MHKEYKDMTFDELVEYFRNYIMTGLFEGGGKELKARLHLAMGQAIVWNNEQEEKKKKEKK